jgi:hypothetical protein
MASQNVNSFDGQSNCKTIDVDVIDTNNWMEFHGNAWNSINVLSFGPFGRVSANFLGYY